MVHTVGIVGANGGVGAPAVKYLAQAASEGKINLVVYHREGKEPKLESTKNVERRELSFDDSADRILSAAKGVNVFISSVGFDGIRLEPQFVEALSKSKDLITYIPTSFSLAWTADDKEHPQIGPMVAFSHGGELKARELGIPVTEFYCGAFENYVFEYGFLDSPLKGNYVTANKAQLENGVAITVREHLGYGIAEVATRDPQLIKGKSFSVVTFTPTGDELAKLYTKLNGKQAEIKDYADAEREALLADGANLGPIKAGYFERWQSGQWGYEADGKTKVGGGYATPTLEEVARRFL